MAKAVVLSWVVVEEEEEEEEKGFWVVEVMAR